MRIPFAAAAAAALFTACATSKSEAPKSEAPPPFEVKSTGVPGEAMAKTEQVVTAKVKAIDVVSRKLTIEAPDGETETFKVSAAAERFDELDAGDEITVRVSQGLLLQYQPVGAKAVEPKAVLAGGLAPAPLPPGAAVTGGVQGTVTSVKIDQGSRVVTFLDPDGYQYKVKAGPELHLDEIKVGDRLLATYIATVALAVEKK